MIMMKVSVFSGLFLLMSTFSITSAQPVNAASQSVSANASPEQIAAATLKAHGGDKLKKMKSFLVKGSVDVSAMGQAMPGVFSTAVSGDKYYFEINSVMQNLKQVYNGSETYSSLPGFSLPPVTSLGFPLLPRIGDAGYVISALGGDKKKGRGFRVTTPEGFYTDFYVNEKTNQLKGYDSAFESAGQVVTTSVEIDEMFTVDGIVVPKKYSQRFDLGKALTAYAAFNAKTVLVNSTIEDSAFSIPK